VTAWRYLCTNQCLENLFSVERDGVATNSERRRWLQNKAVIINGVKPQPDDEVTFPINQLVFFPKSQKKRITFL
jgi:hypothetical protein